MEEEIIFIKQEPIDWESHFISEDGYLPSNISVLEEHVEVMEAVDTTFDLLEIKDEPITIDTTFDLIEIKEERTIHGFDEDISAANFLESLDQVNHENVQEIDGRLNGSSGELPEHPKITMKNIGKLSKERLLTIIEAVQKIVLNKTDKFLDLKRNKIQICSDCGFIGTSTSEMLKHVHKKEGQSISFLCQACGSNFRNKDLYLTHSHASNCKKCRYCGGIACCRLSLIRHEAACQKNRALLQSRIEKLYSCLICLNTFISKHVFEKHMNSCTPTITDCKYCIDDSSENFIRSVKIKKIPNLYSHDPNVVYTCDFCENVFHSHLLLSRHMATCREEDEYICSKCSRGFSRKASLIEHINKCQSVEGSMLQCSRCGATFSSSESLAAHKINCPYACMLCGSEFHSYKVLQEHVRSHILDV